MSKFWFNLKFSWLWKIRGFREKSMKYHVFLFYYNIVSSRREARGDRGTNPPPWWKIFFNLVGFLTEKIQKNFWSSLALGNQLLKTLSFPKQYSKYNSKLMVILPRVKYNYFKIAIFFINNQEKEWLRR